MQVCPRAGRALLVFDEAAEAGGPGEGVLTIQRLGGSFSVVSYRFHLCAP